jgi:DNA polymerase I-like protein with 3'-5' exonuclease and polymerase domains
MSDPLSDLFSADVAPVETAVEAPVTAPRRKMGFDSVKGDATALDNAVFYGEVGDLTRPWMRFHRFRLVTTAAEVRTIVDRALQVGRIALDLETEGLDNRINFHSDGSFSTEHKIVGYCLGLEGEGFYIPVRHYQGKEEHNPNVDSVDAAEAEITRLCLEAQPILKDGSIDMLGAKEKDFAIPPRVVIEFWHAKFDQEFLYPVTGIDIWNPASFDDGMLMVYTQCTEAEQSLKESARQRLPPQIDPETGAEYRYEMIKFKDLFSKSERKSGSDLKFAYLAPRDVGPGKNVVLYGCSDGICTNLLCKLLRTELASDKKQLGFYQVEKQVAQVVRVIERTRVLIDKGEIATLLEEADRELEECEAQIVARAMAVGFPADFNPSSSAQLADFLFGPQGIWTGEKPEKTKEGQYKTDEKTLEKIAEDPKAKELEAFHLIIKHRQINKVRGTYLQNLANNTDQLNQLRLNFKQTGAATGRFTAPKGDPKQGFAGVPIQGIPARDDPKKPKVAHSLRRVFIARPGYIIVKADYASQELRIAASTSGEQKWIDEYEKEKATGTPADLHYLTALAFYPGLTKDAPDYKIKRNGGKTANFALIYGGGVGAVERATGCDKVEGTRLKKAFDDSVPGFSRWVKAQHKRVKEDGGVYTAFKRFIKIPDTQIDREAVIRKWMADPKNVRPDGKPKFSESEVAQEVKKIGSSCERKATNYPIQGCGADILKISLILLLREFHLRGWLKNGGDDSVRIIMTVHDEVVFEVRKDRVADALPVIVKIMESPTTMLKGWKVPLVVEAEIGPSWAAKISWSAVLKGDSPPPEYLAGKTLTRDADVLVLRKKDSETPPPAGGSTPPAMPDPPARPTTPAPVASPPPAQEAPYVEPTPPKPTSAPAVSVGAKGNGKRRIASVRLKSAFIDRETACSVALACMAANVEAQKLRKLEERLPVEFLAGGERPILLYSAKHNYLVYVPELEGNLRRMSLLEDCVVREESHG